LAVRVAERIHSLFCPRFLFVSPRTAEGRGKAAHSKGIQQCSGLQQTATLLRSQSKWIGSFLQRLPVLVHNQLGSQLLRIAVAKFDHFWEFVTGIHVQKGKRDFPRKKRFLCQPQHHRGIFANGIKHCRTRKLFHGFAQNIDALRFQSPQVAQSFRWQTKFYCWQLQVSCGD
jgi:hypothetical protein